MKRELAEYEAENAKRLRRKFISANTAEPGYADYMAAWVRKIESTVNQRHYDKLANFPDEDVAVLAWPSNPMAPWLK